MNNMQKPPLQEAVERAHALGRRAVIPFITAGFPDKDSFWTHLSRIDESGADIIEIGVPFSDPVADGPVIEQASRDALARGVSLKWILDGLKARKGCFSAKLVLMGYVNPFYQYGLEQLARDAEEAGVSGFIVPDMPLEESGMFREVFSPPWPDARHSGGSQYFRGTHAGIQALYFRLRLCGLRSGNHRRESQSGAERDGNHAPCAVRF